MIAVILMAVSLCCTPRATAKFCFNGVVETQSIAKVAHRSERQGCRSLTVTRINDDYSHVYSVAVIIGE